MRKTKKQASLLLSVEFKALFAGKKVRKGEKNSFSLASPVLARGERGCEKKRKELPVYYIYKTTTFSFSKGLNKFFTLLFFSYCKLNIPFTFSHLR